MRPPPVEPGGGDSEGFPFADVEKEQFVRFVSELEELYTIEPLSAVTMSDHRHTVCAVPAELPSKPEAKERWLGLPITHMSAQTT